MTRSEFQSIEFAAYLGLDWADQKHLISLQPVGAPGPERLELEHKPEAIVSFVAQLQQRFRGRPVAIALEQSRGAVIYSLMHYDFIVLYPVNPKALASYREAFYPSGAKDDPQDAQLLQEMVSLHRQKLHPWVPDDTLTREISLLVSHRRKLVDDRTRLTNRLRALLKLYFPQAITWAGGSLDTLLAIDLLRRWPQLEAIQQASAEQLREFYRQHRTRLGEKLEARLEEISRAKPLTRDSAVISSSVCLVQALLEPLRAIVAGIETLDRQIRDCYENHPDHQIFASLPGAGPALGPRLLAAFGTDRERYQSSEEMERYSGIAPVTKRSGKTKIVQRRLACPKFVRQSFHEFARCSINWSSWARAYYQQKRERGSKHHEAVRALAYKWIRVIFACWQKRVAYDDGIYQAALERRGSPLSKLIAPATIQTTRA